MQALGTRAPRISLGPEMASPLVNKALLAKSNKELLIAKNKQDYINRMNEQTLTTRSSPFA